MPLRRYAAYLLACLLSCIFVLVFTLGSVAPASAQTAITWEDLQPQSNNLRNPYEHLTTAQTYQLSSLYQLQEWVKVNQPAPESPEIKELQRLEDYFAAEGIDANELLKDADEAREYWAAESRSTNADITNSLVVIDGYLLPLEARSGSEEPQAKADKQSNQEKPVSEFFLVPYVGACIHVPSPPPNQMVYIKTAKAVENPGMFSPVQVEGELQAHEGSYELFQVDGSRTIDVSYKMNVNSITPTTNQPVAPSQVGGSLLTLEGWKQLPATISNTLTTALNHIQSQKSPRAMVWALLLSFSYGVLHTLGPGHGKAVIVSYFVGQGGSLQRGLRMGGQIAIFHVLSATLLVIVTDTLVRQVGGSTERNYHVVQLISYGAIALLGGWMLRQTLTQKAKYQTAPSAGVLPPNKTLDKATDGLLYPSLSQQIESSVEPAKRQTTSQQGIPKGEQDNWIRCSCLSCEEASSVSGWLALAVGAVPCSGALLVLLYGLANDMLWQSVTMVLAISTGMAMTLALIGVMAIFTHRWGAQVAQARLERKKALVLPIPFAQLGRIIGASCVFLLGVSLFAATWVTGV